ncbi:MAG: 50S ribosomal protein L22 [Aeriscardovia sp.]|nr:50S ribosomal protein L22 [Aeriscardovia sp.]
MGNLEAKAIARRVRVTPRKARRMVDLIRGKNVQEARIVLQFAPQTAAKPVRKVVESAIANAHFLAEKSNQAFHENDLVVKTIMVDEGATMKRFRPRAQGRAGAILKRTCQITVVVSSEEGVR